MRATTRGTGTRGEAALASIYGGVCPSPRRAKPDGSPLPPLGRTASRLGRSRAARREPGHPYYDFWRAALGPLASGCRSQFRHYEIAPAGGAAVGA